MTDTETDRVCERCGKTIPDDGHKSCPHCGCEPSDTMTDYKTKTLSEMKELVKENNGVLLNIFEKYTRNHPNIEDDEIFQLMRSEILERMSIFTQEERDALALSFTALDTWIPLYELLKVWLNSTYVDGMTKPGTTDDERSAYTVDRAKELTEKIRDDIILKNSPPETEGSEPCAEQHPDYDFCPTCGEHYTRTCKCMKSDRTCPNGHHWHMCLKHNKTVIGKSDHSKPMMDCSCEGEK